MRGIHLRLALGTPQPAIIHDNGLSIPAHLDQAQLHTWLLSHPRQAQTALFPGVPASQSRSVINQQITQIDGSYLGREAGITGTRRSGGAGAGCAAPPFSWR
jgi:hypothetical protein